jgi:hypothetical protein
MATVGNSFTLLSRNYKPKEFARLLFCDVLRVGLDAGFIVTFIRKTASISPQSAYLTVKFTDKVNFFLRLTVICKALAQLK